MFVEKVMKVFNPRGYVYFQTFNSGVNYISTTSFNKYLYDCLKDHSEAKRFKPKKPVAVRRRRTFIEHESKEGSYARSILNNSEVYHKSISLPLACTEYSQIDRIGFLMEKNWHTMDSAELVKNFELLSFYASKNQISADDCEFKDIFKILTLRCFKFSDEELQHFLSCLELWYENKQPYNMGIWEAIDKECLNRMPKWSIEKLLLTNDQFFKLNIIHNSDFSHASLKKIIYDLPNLTPQNLVQLSFLLKVSGRCRIDFKIFEDCIERCVDELTAEEIGIIAMAFFKYEHCVKNEKLLLKLFRVLQSNTATISDISLASFLKLMKISPNLKISHPFNILLTSLVEEVPKRTLPCLTQMAQFQASNILHCPELISGIIERFSKDIKSARLKDIERLMYALYCFNYNPSETPLFHAAAKELMSPHRNEEIESYPHSFVYTIMYWLETNFYWEKAIRRVLDPEFIKHVSKNDIHKLGREYLCIDYCLELEHPNYTGPRLKKYLLNILVKKIGSLSEEVVHGIARPLKVDRFLTDVSHSLKQILQSDNYVYMDALLPHFDNRNIIICHEPKTDKFLEPGKYLSQLEPGTLKYAPKDDNKWYALVMGMRNSLTKNTYQKTGIIEMQLRHLKVLGYTPILLPYVDWPLGRPRHEKRYYLRKNLAML